MYLHDLGWLKNSRIFILGGTVPLNIKTCINVFIKYSGVKVWCTEVNCFPKKNSHKVQIPKKCTWVILSVADQSFIGRTIYSRHGSLFAELFPRKC